jgi:hypothetical protein
MALRHGTAALDRLLFALPRLVAPALLFGPAAQFLLLAALPGFIAPSLLLGDTALLFLLAQLPRFVAALLPFGEAALLLLPLALLFLLAFAPRLFALALFLADLPLGFAGRVVVAVTLPAAIVVRHCRGHCGKGGKREDKTGVAQAGEHRCLLSWGRRVAGGASMRRGG